jgi:hypothetical protein
MPLGPGSLNAAFWRNIRPLRKAAEFAKLRPAKMKHVVSHDLGQARAKEVAQSALSSYKDKFAKYSPEVRWQADNKANIAFKIKGMTISGSLEVLEKTNEMDLEVPFMLRPFKSQALNVIEGEIQDWIKKAKTPGQ